MVPSPLGGAARQPRPPALHPGRDRYPAGPQRRLTGSRSTASPSARPDSSGTGGLAIPGMPLTPAPFPPRLLAPGVDRDDPDFRVVLDADGPARRGRCAG